MKILVVGELNADLILNNLNSSPQLGKEVLCHDVELVMGSSSAIFACNLSELGNDVFFKGLLGNDLFGDLVFNSLEAHHVKTKLINRSDQYTTGLSVATCYTGDRTMVTMPGAMTLLTEKDIADEELSIADHLHVSSIFLQTGLKPGIIKLLQRAKQIGLTTSLDPQYDPNEIWDLEWSSLLKYVDVFLPNKSELIGITSSSSLNEAIEKIKQYPIKQVIVKNGEKGALAIAENTLIEGEAYINHNVVDVIGAGDSFDAGFVHAFIRKLSIPECLKYGNVMGALNTTAKGGSSAFNGGLAKIRTDIFNNFKITL